jgi:hypothetical protein
MLSAPSPSEAAKFIGQILSIISSTILDNTTVPLAFIPLATPLEFDPLIPGDPDAEFCLLRPGEGFFVGEDTLFLPWELY